MPGFTGLMVLGALFALFGVGGFVLALLSGEKLWRSTLAMTIAFFCFWRAETEGPRGARADEVLPALYRVAGMVLTLK